MKILKLLFSLCALSLWALVSCSSDDQTIAEPSSNFLMGKTISEVTVGEEVQFNSSAANADAYYWDFGDDTKSEEQNPVKPYFDSGVYTVTLRVENQGGSASFSQDITVLPFVDFEVENADDLDTESEVRFTNLSKGADSFEWKFGDDKESTSNQENPSFAYTQNGAYTVTLTAVGDGGSQLISKKIQIGTEAAGDGEDTDTVETPHDLFFIDYDQGTIEKLSMPDATTTVLVADVSGKAGVGLAYDAAGGKIYFSDFEDAQDGKVWRMNEDGSNLEELVSGIVDPYSVALNFKDGKIYWADDDGHVSSANLDGSDLAVDFIEIPDGMMRGIDYDSKHDKIYFYEVNEEVLYVADSNGGNVTPVVEGTYGYAVFVDEEHDKLYYDDQRGDAIVRVNLDGSDPEVIADVSDRVHGMAIDYDSQKFYWSERSSGTINRSNLDGSEMENVLSDLASPRGLFIK